MNTQHIEFKKSAVIPAPIILAAISRIDTAEEAHNMQTALAKIIALGGTRIITEGTAVHRAGDVFRSVYFLKSGAAKRLIVQEDGREQVLGFPMPGELIGIEAIDSRRHTTTVMTLDMCAVVEIPFEAIERLASTDANVAHFLFRTLSGALREEHGLCPSTR
jgi:CRP-like cAMP-binding protein